MLAVIQHIVHDPEQSEIRNSHDSTFYLLNLNNCFLYHNNKMNFRINEIVFTLEITSTLICFGEKIE